MIKLALLITALAFLAGCSSAQTKCASQHQGACLTEAREIEGWPDWLCQDFEDGREQSAWKYKGSALTLYNRRCDDWKRPAPVGFEHPLYPAKGLTNPPPPRLYSSPNPEELKEFHRVKGWMGWICADYKDKRRRSAWKVEGPGNEGASVYEGTCKEWEQQEPEPVNN